MHGFVAALGLDTNRVAALRTSASAGERGVAVALAGVPEVAEALGLRLTSAHRTLAEAASGSGTVLVGLKSGHYVAVTDCDSAFVTLLGADGRRARFPKDALESGMSGIMFVSPDLLEGEEAEDGQ